MRTRLVRAGAVLLLGIGFCFFMYWWQLRYRYAFHGISDNLFLALPFGGLAVMVLGGLSRVATLIGWLTLALLTGGAYTAAAKSSSSTASLVFLAPFFYGAIVLSILFAIDSIVRGSKISLRAWRDWHGDDRRL